MHDQTVTALNALLRGERRAVKCYQRVVRNLPVASVFRPAAEECLASHQGRAVQLKIELARRGGRAIDDSRLGGGLVAFLAGLCALAWVRLAARMLEVVESRGIARYDRSWEMLDEAAREFLTSCLFPEQVLCYQSIALLGGSERGFVETPTS